MSDSQSPQTQKKPWVRFLVHPATLATAIVAVLAAGLLSWVFTYDIYYVELSRAVKLGMSKDDVYGIMGEEALLIMEGGEYPPGFYGDYRTRTGRLKMDLRVVVLGMLGRKTFHESWPVIIYYDSSGHVIRIKRGWEIEAAP